MSHLNIANRPAHSLYVGRVVAVIVRVLPSNTAPLLGLQYQPCNVFLLQLLQIIVQNCNMITLY